MNKMTGEEIIRKLSESHMSVDDFAYGQIPWFPEDAEKSKEISKRIAKWDAPERKAHDEEADLRASNYFTDLVGSWSEIASYGGEGCGDMWWSVKYFPDHDVYIKVSGFYASYDGTTFDGWGDCTVVFPREKTITVYE